MSSTLVTCSRPWRCTQSLTETVAVFASVVLQHSNPPKGLVLENGQSNDCLRLAALPLHKLGDALSVAEHWRCKTLYEYTCLVIVIDQRDGVH
jgi:hypothetical protein